MAAEVKSVAERRHWRLDGRGKHGSGGEEAEIRDK